MKQVLSGMLMLMLLGIPIVSQAQLAPKSVTFHNASDAVGDGNPIEVGQYNSVGFDVEITDTATVTFEILAKSGGTWRAMACLQTSDTDSTYITTLSASGAVQCNIAGMAAFRVRISSYTGGTVSASGRATIAVLARRGGSGSGGVSISSGTDLPASCTPATGPNALFFDTDDNILYYCSDTDTFVQVNPAEADTLDSVFDRGKTIDGANSFANAFRVVDENGDGFAIYTDSTDGPIFVCIDNNVENACTSYTRTLASGQTLVYKNSGGTAIFTLTESTGAITNAKIDGEGTGNTITLTEERHWPVATAQNGVAQAVFDLNTSNTPAPTVDAGSNTYKAYLAFDATTDEAFQDSWILPTGFTGAIDVHFRWKAAATSGAVGWCAQLVRVPDAATSDPAFPAQASGNCVSDTAKGTTLQENTATISGVTCTSCVAGDHVYVRISRDANGGAVTDDMSGDALLLTYGRTWRIAH